MSISFVSVGRSVNKLIGICLDEKKPKSSKNSMRPTLKIRSIFCVLNAHLSIEGIYVSSLRVSGKAIPVCQYR